ncbi:DUF2795 domain-containing protein [Pseudonocardia abyssalis]|uniref:DUF2795 domain-containing protein n=1 Tax=Pseudonocardia abyssalis TaxID=2792008 RepID=A0ABS6US54_9PSEU|nr:DUF2795 domain-containing protein [Pseudonocardia abyssalis]MBW0115821.1 DUF2795 domain-containing protein [Pseudonocardia abyssalis]MBW0135065.1 DUF2795 domain-containing protein [Pseudonocardia abyssalis]
MTHDSQSGQHPVTRMEILDVVEGVFVGHITTKIDILAAAQDHGARGPVLDTLARLDGDRRFVSPHDLWIDLADVPVDV